MSPETLVRHRRRVVTAGLLALAARFIAGCGTSPPLRLYRLPLPAPEAPAGAVAGSAVWELAMRPGLPAYLDRDELLVDRGQGRVEALTGERWAEPLAEALPRLLLHDLALLRGASQVWPAPAPAGAGARQRLRVQVLGLQAELAAGVLRLQARWTVEDMNARVAPQVGQADLEVPLAQADAPGLVQAHRLALWRLAQRIAADTRP